MNKLKHRGLPKATKQESYRIHFQPWFAACPTAGQGQGGPCDPTILGHDPLQHIECRLDTRFHHS